MNNIARTETSTQTPGATKRGTIKARHIKVDEQLWATAAAQANADGETISGIVRALLRGYIRGDFEV